MLLNVQDSPAVPWIAKKMEQEKEENTKIEKKRNTKKSERLLWCSDETFDKIDAHNGYQARLS